MIRSGRETNVDGYVSPPSDPAATTRGPPAADTTGPPEIAKSSVWSNVANRFWRKEKRPERGDGEPLSRHDQNVAEFPGNLLARKYSRQ
jgi:hypothetical protein